MIWLLEASFLPPQARSADNPYVNDAAELPAAMARWAAAFRASESEVAGEASGGGAGAGGSPREALDPDALLRALATVQEVALAGGRDITRDVLLPESGVSDEVEEVEEEAEEKEAAGGGGGARAPRGRDAVAAADALVKAAEPRSFILAA
jgi:hypothetical protein